MAAMANRTIKRHALWVRMTHAMNALCLILLLMSGLQIFDAHPAYYIGTASNFADPLVALPDGVPHWLTMPGYQDLATGRLWHFFLAWILVINGAVYLLTGLLGGHLTHDLLPGPGDPGIGASLRAHLRLRFHAADQARRYNPLQKLTYLIVIFVLLPMMLITGLAMSPAIDAWVPALPWLLLGRQTARTVHGAVALLLVIFTVVHLLMVALSGPGNNLRGIVTGRIRDGSPRRPRQQ